MTSHPAASCCYQGFEHDGQPAGTIMRVGEIEAYVSYPADKSTKRGVLFLTDIIGHRFPNTQLLADEFAKNGYFVMVPDLFHGDPIPLNRPGDFDMDKWKKGEFHPQKKSHLPMDVDPIIEASIAEMRTKYGCEKIGAVGYCFGGKYVVRHLQPGQIDVGYTAHPSHVTLDELKSIEGPLAIAAAETDRIFPPEKRHETEAVLQEVGRPYQVNLYSGVEHGFAVRGDPGNRVAQYAKENAFWQAVAWFQEHLG